MTQLHWATGFFWGEKLKNDQMARLPRLLFRGITAEVRFDGLGR